MGMAASQARLLSITSRLHDVEYAAQNLQNVKLQLATQQDAAYEEYLNALDQRTLTFASIDASGNRSDLTATFNNLFSVNAANTATGSNYALIDSRGRVVVTDDLENGYDAFTHDSTIQNANLFALYMIFGNIAGDEDFNQIADEVLNDRINSDSHLSDLYDNAINGRGDDNEGRSNIINPGEEDNPTGPELPSGEEEQGTQIPDDDEENDNENQSGTIPAQSPWGNYYKDPITQDNPSTTVTVHDKEPVDPKPVPPPQPPTAFGSITASTQQKPPQRGGDSNDGGKGVGDGGKGGRGSSSVGNNVNTSRAGSAETPVTTTLPNNDNSVKVPRTATTEPEPIQEPPSAPGTTPPNTPLGNRQYIPRSGEVSLENILAQAGAHPEEVQQFLNYFFNRYRTDIFNNTQFNASALPNFDYYVRMFNAIQQHGGCISIDDFNGPDGSAANNSEWLTAMIESGQFSLEVFNVDAQGNVTTSGIGVDSDSNLMFASTTQIDKRALAKAEAAYEHAMKVINRKEKKIDNELNKIETERNALTKEYDSVKKVAEDNIERTFGIFS